MQLVDVANRKAFIGGHPHLTNGFQTWDPLLRLPRHGHVSGYATVIVSGGFRESGNWGRFHVGPGDVLVHKAFDIHRNEMFVTGATVIHLALDSAASLPGGLGHIRDLDAFVCATKADFGAAASLLAELFVPAAAILKDWSDKLAADILNDPCRRIETWAAAHDVNSEELLGEFQSTFGVTPENFRLEARARKAIALIVGGAPFLKEVSDAAGFQNQAQMYRAVKALTGEAPLSWLRRVWGSSLPPQIDLLAVQTGNRASR